MPGQGIDATAKTRYNGRDSLNNKWKKPMASRCELTGKRAQHGHNVSFSLRRTKRVFKPNLQKKTFVVDGQKVTMTLSTQAIRTLKKKGVLPKSGTATISAKAQ